MDLLGTLERGALAGAEGVRKGVYSGAGYVQQKTKEKYGEFRRKQEERYRKLKHEQEIYQEAYEKERKKLLAEKGKKVAKTELFGAGKARARGNEIDFFGLQRKGREAAKQDMQPPMKFKEHATMETPTERFLVGPRGERPRLFGIY